MITNEKNVPLADLQSIPVAGEGDFVLTSTKQPPSWKWQGIGHHELLSSLIAEAHTTGMRVDETQIALSSDKLDMAVSLSIFHPRYSQFLPDGLSLSLGIETSNAGRQAFTTYYGVTTIWGAGIPLGYLLPQRRHTFGIDLERITEEILIEFRKQAADTPFQIRRLKNTPLTIEEVSTFLVEAGDRNYLPSSRIVRVLRECNNPQFGSKDESSWGLLHAFAVIARMNPPLSQMDQVYSFRKMLPVKGERK